MIASLPVNGGGGNGGPMSRVGRGLALHRSNSSLELPHSPDPASRIPETPLRREYGSHGKYMMMAKNFSSPPKKSSVSVTRLKNNEQNYHRN